MFHNIFLTDWHQLFLIAAGFLTATLLVWAQFWVNSFYDEQLYDKRPEDDRRFSVNVAGLWLFSGVLFALLAFSLTGLDWLYTSRLVHTVLYHIELIERLATGFLMGAFEIALVAVVIQLIMAWRTLKEKGNAKRIRMDYTDKRKRYLFIAVCVIPFLLFAVSILLTFII
ncbi:MAG: hypothetical protein ABSB38_00215 [Dehalococcoidia bacterium]|jgi:hypothetical protein